MNKSLHWKKTIGILAIILGALRFISCLSVPSQITELETVIDDYNSVADSNLLIGIRSYLSTLKDLFPFELIAVALILILGITLLCVDRGIPENMPRKKSRNICTAILVTSIAYLIMEIILLSSTPSELGSEVYSPAFIIGSLGFVVTLIIFCILGLCKKNNPNYMTTFNQSQPQPQNEKSQLKTTPLDIEIDNLKKEIERRKLEKELAELNKQKLTEIEKLKQELTELDSQTTPHQN